MLIISGMLNEPSQSGTFTVLWKHFFFESVEEKEDSSFEPGYNLSFAKRHKQEMC